MEITKTPKWNKICVKSIHFPQIVQIKQQSIASVVKSSCIFKF